MNKLFPHCRIGHRFTELRLEKKADPLGADGAGGPNGRL